jgi:hypothetical protein
MHISPVWLEKPERIAALAMLTVVGLLVYAVIQRQVRLQLYEHERQLPGNTGLTATPTAAVVFALFTPVMLVHCTVDDIPGLQVHGVQDYHRLICDAVGIAQTWYQGVATDQICAAPHIWSDAPAGPMPTHGPWQYQLSRLYDTPQVTAAVEGIAAEKHPTLAT